MENRHGYCQCGCGQKTKVSPETNRAKGWVKGEPRRFLNHHNSKGENHPNWKGGKRKRGDGYILVRTGPSQTEFEHRLNAKRQHGGELPDGAIVHHLNGKQDNETVQVCLSHAEHRMIHVREKALQDCGHEDWRKCHYCHQYDDPANLTKYASGHYHKKCASEYVAKRRKEKGRKRDHRGWLV